MRRRTVKKPTVFDPSPESTSSGAPKSVVQPLSPSASDQTASPSQSSSSSDLPVLSPGDALTVWCEEKNPAGDPHDVPYCATVRARTASGYTIIWRCPGRDCDGVPDEVIFSEDAWLPGWHDDAGLDQAQGRAEPPTTSIEDLMQTCKISEAPKLSAVFCTLCYPRGRGTCAAFDLDPGGTSPIGSYIPVDVRLYEMIADQALMLAVYRPEPLYVRIDTRDTLDGECGATEVAIGLRDSAVLYLSFGSTELKRVFMLRVREIAHDASVELAPEPMSQTLMKRLGLGPLTKRKRQQGP